MFYVYKSGDVLQGAQKCKPLSLNRIKTRYYG